MFRDQETVRKKPKQEITYDDIKHLNPTKAKEALKYNMAQAEWWKRQAEQNQQEDKDKIIADLKKENKDLKQAVNVTREFFMHVINSKSSDAELGREVRKGVKQWLRDEVKSKSKPKIGPMGKAKEKADLLSSALMMRESRRQRAEDIEKRKQDIGEKLRAHQLKRLGDGTDTTPEENGGE